MDKQTACTQSASRSLYRSFQHWALAMLLFVGNGAVFADEVTGLVLVDAGTNTDIRPLVSGDSLNLATLPASLSVRATTSPDPTGSVRFDFNGTQNFQTESVAPYALGGDSSGNFNAVSFPLGSNVIAATAYTGANASGNAGSAVTVSFTVIDQPAPVIGVDAGPDQALVLPADSTTLTATTTGTGSFTFSWSQTAGPATATLVSPGSASTSVNNLVAGRYTFEVQATDPGSTVLTDSLDVVVIAPGASLASVSGELRKWHRVQLDYLGPSTSETASPNPFTDYRLDVTFVHPASGKQYVVPGFFAADGDAADTSANVGNTWRVYFAPDEIGEWVYSASFRAGTNVAVDINPLAGGSAGFFDGDSGSFSIATSDKTGRDHRGKGRLQYVGERYLKFAETGEYFLKQGADAPENLLAYSEFDGNFGADGQKDNLVKDWAPHVMDWNPGDPVWQSTKGKGLIGALNYLASEGQNAVSFLTMNIGGDDRNVFPYLDYNERLRLDVSRLAQWEIVFSHADTLGLYLHFKTQETENEMLLDNGNTGTQRRLYYRELIARFGHHLALNWNLGEENGALQAVNQDTAQRLAMGNFFAQNDPYKHHIVIHNPRDPDDLLGPGSPLTGFSLQTSNSTFSQVHDRVLEWIDDSAAAGKQWVVACDEPGDAQAALRPDSNPGAAQVNGRKNALWGTLMAGGAGNEWYFGYGYPHSDLTLTDFRSRDNWWDVTRYALQFFADNKVPFWNMTSADGLSSISSSYVFRQANNIYLLYLKNGGTATLDMSESTGQYVLQWFNPRSGGALITGTPLTLNASSSTSIGPPPASTSADWLAVIRIDSDADAVADVEDAFPGNPNESLDTDGDGMGDNFEQQYGFDLNDPSDAALDADGDGDSNLVEFQNNSNPLVGIPVPVPMPWLAMLILATGLVVGGYRGMLSR